jgi:hypothetical protein
LLYAASGYSSYVPVKVWMQPEAPKIADASSANITARAIRLISRSFPAVTRARDGRHLGAIRVPDRPRHSLETTRRTGPRSRTSSTVQGVPGAGVGGGVASGEAGGVIGRSSGGVSIASLLAAGIFEDEGVVIREASGLSSDAGPE